MDQYVFRLATPDDMADVRRLQAQLSVELNDPLGATEGSHEHSEFTLLETVGEGGTRIVGLVSLMRACSAPFFVEQIFPNVWERVDLRALTGRSDIGRDDVVENDWGYLEREHRKKGLTRTLWAGSMLLAYHRGHPVIVGATNPTGLATMRNAFHMVGLSHVVSGIRYELGTIFPGEIAPSMANIVRDARARDPSIVWHLPGLDD